MKEIERKKREAREVTTTTNNTEKVEQGNSKEFDKRKREIPDGEKIGGTERQRKGASEEKRSQLE